MCEKQFKRLFDFKDIDTKLGVYYWHTPGAWSLHHEQWALDG